MQKNDIVREQQVAMLSHRTIEYLVAHELVHLVEHSPVLEK